MAKPDKPELIKADYGKNPWVLLGIVVESIDETYPNHHEYALRWIEVTCHRDTDGAGVKKQVIVAIGSKADFQKTDRVLDNKKTIKKSDSYRIRATYFKAGDASGKFLESDAVVFT